MSHEQQISNNLTGVIYGYNESYLNGTGSNIPSNLPGAPTWELYPMPIWLRWLFYAFFFIIVLLAIVLNFMVIFIVLYFKKMRQNATNYCILSLAFADLLTSICNTPWNFVYMMNNDWQWGETFCKIDQFLANAFIAASVITLLVTSIDRYIVLTRPLRATQSKMKMVMIILGILGFSLAASTPNLYFFELYRKSNISTSYFCKWDQDSPNAELRYNIFFMIFIYFLPIFIMAPCYYHICKLLWHTRAIGELTVAQRRIQEDRKRMIIMLILVVLSFALCWLPFHVYFVVEGIWPSVRQCKYAQIIFISFYAAAMLNSTLNPLIYYLFLPNFRRRFKQIFRCILCLSFRETRQRAIAVNQQNGLSNGATMDTFISRSQKHSLESLDPLTDKVGDDAQ